MAKRKGQWAYSQPFSLNSCYYGTAISSYKFITPTMPIESVITQWDVSGADPSGSRHLKTHASYMKILGSGQGIASTTFPWLDLGPTNISTGSGISKTRCFTFRIRKLPTPNTRVSNMRIWCSDNSDFLTPETAKVIFETSSTWVANKVLPTSYLINRNKWMPTSLPTENLRRTDGGLTIHGSGDADVSQYVYVALASSGNTPLGEYGSTVIASGFKIRVTFDYDNIDYLFD